MARVEHSVVINRPTEEVFAYLDNAENGPLWQSGLLESEYTSEGPVGVGTTKREVRKLRGQRFEQTSEIIEYEPNKKVTFKSLSGPLPSQASWTFEPAEGGTRFSGVLEIEARGFLKLAEPIVARLTERQIEADLANLKDLLEAQTEGSA